MKKFACGFVGEGGDLLGASGPSAFKLINSFIALARFMLNKNINLKMNVAEKLFHRTSYPTRIYKSFLVGSL